jgi:pimeloyl-ACP methyl ester carboxylesterase
MRIFKALSTAVLAMMAGATASGAQQTAVLATRTPATVAASAAGKPTIVLVHGAFADASGWQDLIPLLQDQGFRVVAVQNPLASLAGDVETTRRAIDAQSGPVVLVGHSYGGAVISGAAEGSDKVSALVYIAAFGPEAGEPVGAYLEKYPTGLGASLRPDAAGFAYIDSGKYHDIFAGDLPMRQTRAMAVAQKPIAGAIFGQSSPGAAWKTIPSWYMVAQQDHALNPDLERFYAKRMNARTREIRSSHLPFISHPREVAKLITDAAAGARR